MNNRCYNTVPLQFLQFLSNNQTNKKKKRNSSTQRKILFRTYISRQCKLETSVKSKKQKKKTNGFKVILFYVLGLS